MSVGKILLDAISYGYKSYTVNKDTVNVDMLEQVLQLCEAKMEISRNSYDVELKELLEDLLDDIKKNTIEPISSFVVKLSLALASSSLMDDMDDVETSSQLAGILVGKDLTEEELKKDVAHLSEKLLALLSAHDLKKLASRISITIKKKTPNMEDIENIRLLLEEKVEKLKSLSTFKQNKNIYETLDFDDPKLYEIAEAMSKQGGDALLFKLGWDKLNRMFQGGFRTKELALFGALTHSYKSGMSTSIYTSIAIFNTPVKRNDKDPMLLFISLEDSLSMVIDNIYTILMNSYHPEINVDVNRVSYREKLEYVKGKLEETGFKVKFVMMDSTSTTAIDVINVIEKYDEQYDVQYICLDYAGKLKSLPVDMSGASGTDKLMIIRRLRVYINKTNKGMYTTWQYNSRAKDLSRNGLVGLAFVEMVANGGYYKDNNTLDTDIDAEAGMHKFSKNKQWYIAIGRGKHRMPSTIEDNDMKFLLKFPLNKKHRIPLEVRPDMEQVAFSTMAEAESGYEETGGNIYG